MPDTPHYINHRKRSRERFHKTGDDGLHDYELHELLLAFSIPRRDLKPVVKKLIEKFGILSGVLDADQQQIEQLNGLGVMSASLIRLIKELYTSYLFETIKDRDVLSSLDAVINFSRVKLYELSDEVFMSVYINVKNEVIDYALLQEGISDKIAVYPRRIIEAALSKHASGIILGHN